MASADVEPNEDKVVERVSTLENQIAADEMLLHCLFALDTDLSGQKWRTAILCITTSITECGACSLVTSG